MTSVSKGGWLTGGCSFSFQAELQCRLPQHCFGSRLRCRLPAGRAGYRQLALLCSCAHSHEVPAMASCFSMGAGRCLKHSREKQQAAPPRHTMAAHQLVPLRPLPAADDVAQGLVSLPHTHLG